ncbi:MAG: hypothetical protein WBJ10_08225 [Daejeonella sp.]|uniref:hypothetical protein n=1 Tax=Daejeonella sp. TaxID=2805397 RepID=UPI003C74CC6E
MTTINNIQPLSAEDVFSLLKNNFKEYVNSKLDSNLEIDYQHVQNIINVLCPEIIEGIAFTITVDDEAIIVSHDEERNEHNSDVLEQHLNDFLAEKAG